MDSIESGNTNKLAEIMCENHFSSPVSDSVIVLYQTFRHSSTLLVSLVSSSAIFVLFTYNHFCNVEAWDVLKYSKPVAEYVCTSLRRQSDLELNDAVLHGKSASKTCS